MKWLVRVKLFLLMPWAMMLVVVITLFLIGVALVDKTSVRFGLECSVYMVKDYFKCMYYGDEFYDE